jgi:hypothetical protein
MLLLLGSADVRAEPLVRMPDQTGSWKIDLRPANAPEPPAGNAAPIPQPAMPPLQMLKELKSIEVTLGGGLRRDVLKWSDGSDTELWKINGKRIEINSSKRASVSPDFVSVGSLFGTWKAFEPAEFEPYTRDAVISTGEYKGKPAIIYENKRVTGLPTLPGAAPNAHASSITTLTKLWVDPDTHYPIALKDSETLYTFHFSDSPPVQLTPPQSCLDELDRYKRLSGVPVPRHEDLK